MRRSITPSISPAAPARAPAAASCPAGGPNSFSPCSPRYQSERYKQGAAQGGGVMHRYCFRRGRITFFGRVEGFDGLTVCLWGGIRLGVGRPGVARLGKTLTSSPLSPGTEATLIIGKPTIQEQIAHQRWHHKRSQAGGLLRVATPGYSLAECG